MTIIGALQQNKRAFGLMCTDEYTNEEMRVKAKEIGFGVFECYENNSDNEWEELGRFNEYNFAQELTYRLRADYTEQDEYELWEIRPNHVDILQCHSPIVTYHERLSEVADKPNFAGYLYEDGKVYPQPVMYGQCDILKPLTTIKDLQELAEFTYRPTYVVFKK